MRERRRAEGQAYYTCVCVLCKYIRAFVIPALCDTSIPKFVVGRMPRHPVSRAEKRGFRRTVYIAVLLLLLLLLPPLLSPLLSSVIENVFYMYIEDNTERGTEYKYIPAWTSR